MLGKALQTNRLIILTLIIIALLDACKEPYEPVVAVTNDNILVVEGFINTGGSPTTIRLTRTANLKTQQVKGEANATLKIEGEDGSIVQGTSDSKGTCILPTNNINRTQKYRLRIITKGGKEYITDFLENKKTPPIDSIEYETDEAGLWVKLSTQDHTNNTRYYGWEFDEVWEFNSDHPSYFEYKNGQIFDRPQPTNFYFCWQNDRSKQILIGSSAMLSTDHINRAPIIYINGNSIKLARFYCINIYQHGITKEAYEYLQKMKKNTEEIGSLFDPQPSDPTGNIKCITNPLEKVIGFISSGSITQKRFYIDEKDLPKNSPAWTYKSGCPPERITHVDSIGYYSQFDYLIARKIPSGLPPPKEFFYTIAPPACIDCRLRGSNIKPSFWPR